MAKLTAYRMLEKFSDQSELPCPVLGKETYYEGAILASVTGYAGVPTGVADEVPLGICSGRYEGGLRDRALAVAENDHKKMVVYSGKVWVPVKSGDSPKIGNLLYLKDDSEVTTTIGSSTYGLVCLSFKTGFALVDFENIVKAA